MDEDEDFIYLGPSFDVCICAIPKTEIGPIFDIAAHFENELDNSKIEEAMLQKEKATLN